MERLTQKDERGNWSLRGVPWEQLHEGQIITNDLYERLYGALWKLMEYEDTGLMPEEVEEIKAGNILNMDDKSILLRQREDGTWEEKPEPYAVIECETEEDFNHIKQMFESTSWIPVEERLPEDDNYILLSFENFSLPLVGRYGADSDGRGAFYLGDCVGEDTCIWQNLFVNAWMPLPEPYRRERKG